MSFIEPKTIPLFYFNGDKATTPTCPVDLIPDLNPSFGTQSYYSSTPDCKKAQSIGFRFSWKTLVHGTMNGASMHTRRGLVTTHRSMQAP